MGYVVSMKDIKKYEVLKQLVDKQIKGYEAASLLGYSQVHTCLSADRYPGLSKSYLNVVLRACSGRRYPHHARYPLISKNR